MPVCFNCSKMKKLAAVFFALSTLLAVSCKSATEDLPKIRVMSFNILQSKGEPEGHQWKDRKDGALAMFKDIAPDVACFQEARRTQCDDLAEAFPEYTQLRCAKDGVLKEGMEESLTEDHYKNGGQRNLIMFKTERFDLLDCGRYWFSETPDSSSLGWDGPTPKVTLWAKLMDKVANKEIFVFCTHFFPHGVECREQCVRMTVDKIGEIAGYEGIVFFCGDLNMDAEDPRLLPLDKYITRTSFSSPKIDRSPTFNGFNDDPSTWTRIDHIYYCHMAALEFKVVNDMEKYGVKFISDHFPVYADFEYFRPRKEQNYYNPSFESECVAKLDEWTPKDTVIKGSTQGFAIHGNDCVVIRDKGECDIFDMEKKEMIGHFKQPGDTSHNNNANFGTERYSDTSRYPLFYTSECRGLKRCFVKDLSLDDAPIVQMFDYYEDVYNGPMDWDLDRDNGFIYTYGGERFGRRWVRKFRLPKFADSDSEGYVHLTKADVLDSLTIDDIGIAQGGIARGKYFYITSGAPPRKCYIMVVDLETHETIIKHDISYIGLEPEGVDLVGDYLYVVFHKSKRPRKSEIWRFNIKG